MKKCINCNVDKPVSEYYNHNMMNDGKLNKCKSCCKEYASKREKKLRSNNEWQEKERARQRDNYLKKGGYVGKKTNPLNKIINKDRKSVV